VGAVAHGNDACALLAGRRNRQLHRLAADYLPESGIAINQRRDAVTPHDLDARPGLRRAGLEATYVDRKQAHDAVTANVTGVGGRQ
jgi:hypothetical protein